MAAAAGGAPNSERPSSWTGGERRARGRAPVDSATSAAYPGGADGARTPSGVSAARGNPVGIRDCPAAVSRNEGHEIALGQLPWEAVVRGSPEAHEREGNACESEDLPSVVRSDPRRPHAPREGAVAPDHRPHRRRVSSVRTPSRGRGRPEDSCAESLSLFPSSPSRSTRAHATRPRAPMAQRPTRPVTLGTATTSPGRPRTRGRARATHRRSLARPARRFLASWTVS